MVSKKPKTSIEIPLQDLSDKRQMLEPGDTVMEEIIRCIDGYETVYKTISSLKRSGKNGIYYKIRELLLWGVNIKIEDLFNKDKKAFKMVLAAFFGQRYGLEERINPETGKKEYIKIDMLPEVEKPLHTVMLMCYAADSMGKEMRKNDEKHERKKDKFVKLKMNLQDIACNMINHLYNEEENGFEIALVALQEDYKSSSSTDDKSSRYQDYLNEKYGRNKEIMAIAYKAAAMKFLSQKPCLILMEKRFGSREIMKSQTSMKPETDAELATEANSENKPETEFLCLTMKQKLWIHTFFRIVYLLSFAYMLCRYPIYGDYKQFSERSWESSIPVKVVYYVLTSQVMITVIKARDFMFFEISRHEYERKEDDNNFKSSLKILSKYFEKNELAIWRLCLVVPLLLLETVRTYYFAFGVRNVDKIKWGSGWSLIPITLELLYCALFAIATLSSIRHLYTFESVGFFSHMIRKMCKTVFMFTLIFSIFWFVLAVIHVSISRSFTSSNDTFLYTVSSVGKFEIFGEVQDEDRIGNLTDCDQHKRTIYELFDMEYAEASCLFRRSIIPFLVFAYIFITGVLLVNLLTAQLTKEYEDESENSRDFHGYLRYEQLAKIESKIYFPQPLSWIYIILRIFFSVFSFKCCSCLDVIWKYTVLKIEGYSWGAAPKLPVYLSNKTLAEIPEQVQTNASVESSIGETPNTETVVTMDDLSKKSKEKMTEYLNNPTRHIWEGLRAVIDKYENKAINSKKLIKAQAEMDLLFEIEKREENTRELMTSRHTIREEGEEPRIQGSPLPTKDLGEGPNYHRVHIQGQNLHQDRQHRLGTSRR